MTISVYYDGDCPFCAKYIALMRLKKAVGTVNLIDLRANPQIKESLTSEGFDLDKGMVVEMNGKKLGGSEAVNQLALLTTPSTLFNRLNKFIMSSLFMATFLYPFLRAGRWFVLFFLGREQISPEEKGALSRAAIFGSVFALFSIFHFFNYSFEYGRSVDFELDLILIVIAAILLFIKPESPRLLFLLMLASTISAVAQAPITSNHTIVRNFVVLGYWISFVYAMFRGLKWSDIFTNFTTAGQASLLVMYFFGVFHKINTDFLNPETSCAVTLWREMPWPLNAIDNPIMHYLAIYGTFAVEGIMLLMLFNRRLRHIAVVCGILFHLMLGLSNFAMYISFSTLAIALHCLFLNEESAKNIQESTFMRAVKNRVKNPAYFALAITLVLLMAMAAWFREYTTVTLLMLPILLPFCYAIIRYGASDKPLLRRQNKKPSNAIGILLGAAFFVNCFMPYLGLKTAQTVGMFANIRLEAGVSNHLIMKDPPKPFTYLEDVVQIKTSTGGENLGYYERENVGMVYYELLSRLDKNPELSISYTRDGKFYADMTAAKLASDIEANLHPRWFRKWFHFEHVSLERPKYCSH